MLGAHATDAVPQGSGNVASASGKHDLNLEILKASESATIVALENRTYVVWRPKLHLSRPRGRLQRPAIYFTASLSISSASQTVSQGPEDQSLQSYEPLPANILEPLRFDPAFASSDISLWESRITKVAPKAPNVADLAKPIRGTSKRAFPAVPALFTRIRYSTLPGMVIASLHLETSPLIAGTVEITKVNVDIPKAKVEDMTKMALPLSTRGGDETILLFKISPESSASAGPAPVSISIRAAASLDQGSTIEFDIDWQANVDLSHTWQDPTYRWSRPLNPSSHNKSLSVQSITRSSLDQESRSTDPHVEAVTFNFTGPPTVHASSEFKLNVHCNNRSLRPRQFGLLMLQPRKARPMSQLRSALTIAGEESVANVFNAPITTSARLPDVLDLNPDVKIGPLPPGACFETHMTFKALRSGVLDLGILRIVDLNSRQTVDVRELPDIVSLENRRE